MKKLIATISILLLSSLTTSSCQKGEEDEAEKLLRELELSDTNSVQITETLPSTILTQTQVTNHPAEIQTNENETRAVEIATQTFTSSTTKTETIPKKIESNKTKTEKLPKGTSTKKTAYTKSRGGYLSILLSGKYASPRNPLTITAQVKAYSKRVKRVKFEIYALPYKSSLLKNKYLLSRGDRIVVIGNKAQFTIVWSGKNIYKKWLPKGKYRLWVRAYLMDSRKKIVGEVAKFWKSKKKYIVLR